MAQSYIELIAKIRRARPDILLSGDFIVGFPEEQTKILKRPILFGP